MAWCELEARRLAALRDRAAAAEVELQRAKAVLAAVPDEVSKLRADLAVAKEAGLKEEAARLQKAIRELPRKASRDAEKAATAVGNLSKQIQVADTTDASGGKSRKKHGKDADRALKYMRFSRWCAANPSSDLAKQAERLRARSRGGVRVDLSEIMLAWDAAVASGSSAAHKTADEVDGDEDRVTRSWVTYDQLQAMFPNPRFREAMMAKMQRRPRVAVSLSGLVLEFSQYYRIYILVIARRQCNRKISRNKALAGLLKSGELEAAYRYEYAVVDEKSAAYSRKSCTLTLKEVRLPILDCMLN